MIKKVFLTFPQRLIREPILYELAQTYDVKTNIRGASVTEEIAVVALQLEGDFAVIEEAVAHLRELGVTAEWLSDG